MRSWREIVVSMLGGELKRRRSFVVDAEIERGEERREDRLGPTEDDLWKSDPEWKPPPDQWAPSRTLGPW